MRIRLNRTAALLPLLAAFALCGCDSSQTPQSDGDVDATPDGTVPARSCRLVSGTEFVEEAQCLALMCFEPTTALAATEDGFYLAYSRNIDWWRTDVMGIVLDRSGEAEGRGTSLSGQLTGAALVRGLSEPPEIAVWDPGFLVLWPDHITDKSWRAAATSVDEDGDVLWEGTRTHLGTIHWIGVEVVAPVVETETGELRRPTNDDIDGSRAYGPMAVANEEGAFLAWRSNVRERDPASGISVGLLGFDGLRTTRDILVSSDELVGASRPTVAASGSSYLVLWSDLRTAEVESIPVGRHGADLWGRLVRTDNLDSCEDDECFLTDEFVIAPAPYASGRPTALWTGEHYLVVWHDHRGGNHDIYSTTILAEPVDGEAVITPLDGTNITASASNENSPQLAASSDGEIYLTWQQSGAPWEDPRPYDIVVSSSRDGGRSWSRPSVVVAEAGQSPSPHLAAAGDNVGLVWHQNPPANSPRRDDGLFPPFEVHFSRVECVDE